MKPFNDEIMTYDLNEHKYYLTADGVNKAIGVNLNLALNSGLSGNPFAVKNFLENVTETVYEYIYEDSSSEAYLEYLLATYAPLRDVVRKMLLAQVKYAIMNNFVDEFSGINIAKGSAMDGRVLRSAVRVAPQVDRLCRQNVPGMNFCLKTITELPLLPSWLYRQGY